MEIRVNDTAPVNQTTGTTPVDTGDGSFKFTLTSAIEEQELQQRLNSLLDDITKQGNLIAQHMDIRDMKKYRGLVKDESDHITILDKIGEIAGLLLDIFT